MNNIIATIFSSLYQQIVLIASCLFILQLPLEKWRNPANPYYIFSFVDSHFSHPEFQQ